MNRNSSSSDFGSGFYGDNPDSLSFGFKDENVCGEGATCHVYRMRLNGLQVAVKRLKREFISNPTYVAAYRKEFQIGQRLKHDGLPTYREYREDSMETYIIMDYVDGMSLEDFIRISEGQAYFKSADNVRRFLKELLSVVGYLHRCGIIHCDVKPANIMLRHSNRGVMLLDLDKAYSDVLDTTHGGTVSISAPLESGQKPTAQKDLAAIGRVIDSMADAVSKFPKLKFRNFRKDCLNGKGTTDSLYYKLQNKSDKWIWRMAVLAVLSLGVFLIGTRIYNGESPLENSGKTSVDTIALDSPIITPTDAALQIGDMESTVAIASDPTHTAKSEFIPNPENASVQETEVRDIMVHNQDEASVNSVGIGPHASEKLPEYFGQSINEEELRRIYRMPTEEESRKNVSQELLAMRLDMDAEMADVIVDMKKAITALHDSNLTYQECRKLVDAASQRELVAFHKVIDKCCEMYPEIDKSDIETEMTRRLDYSQASKLFQQMHKALRQREKAD